MGEFSCSSLLCHETEEACFSETQRDDDESTAHLNCYNSCFVSEDEDKYIEGLVHRETDVGSKTNTSVSDCPTTSKNWLECARLDAIEWIFNTRTVFGFQIHTAYLSVTYFDQFLSRRSLDEKKLWAIRLLSVACLSIAAKMEECRVPALSEFPTGNYQFESIVIQRMELLVLSTLDWKMASITPFHYLYYFIAKFYEESVPKGLLSKAVELIVDMIKEICLVHHHRPSIIAAAAVLAANDIQLTRKSVELKMDIISLWGPLENEHTFSCYNMMQEIEMRKSKTPNLVVSSVRSSAVSTAAGSKRKLTFNDSNQNRLAKKIDRP
ncbi:hypothetical protein PTKIN_Ptkin08bG0122500 [Pterospermum kingtungense]